MNVLKAAKRSPALFVLVFIAAVTVVAISESSYWQSVGKLNDLGTMGTARNNIQDLQQSILDAEIGERGYLLTGRAQYLISYNKAVVHVNQSLHDLEIYYDKNPASLGILTQLRSLMDARLYRIAEAIRLRTGNKDQASTEIITLMPGGEAETQQIDTIQSLSADLLKLEGLKVIAAHNYIHHTLMLSRVAMAVLSAISMLALFMYLRQTVALEKQQLEQKRLIHAERDRLEIVVFERTAQLTELTQHLQTAREDERNRLARNLHDELGALLTSAKLDAARIKSRLIGTAPEALERITHLVGTLNSSIALGRRIIEDLRPSTLSNLGLVATLEILAREFAEQSGVKVHCMLAPVKLDATAELVVYRLVQEAITNITKYAKASHVWISLAANDHHVQVSVRDDGVGFDTSVPQTSAYGLMGMRFRVEAEGGALTLTSAPGQGACIQVRLPEFTHKDI